MRIFKHIKGIKARGIKLKGRFKILSVRKLKRHTGRKYKKMFTPHDTTLNTVDDKNVAAQSIPLGENIPPDENISSFTERTSKQLNLKCRKERYNKETANKYLTDDTTSGDDSEQQIQEKEDNDWRIDFSNEESEEKKDDDWASSFASMEQRNLDSPIVVKMPLDDSTPLTVPKIFKQQHKTQCEMDTYDKNVFTRKTWSKEDNAQIIDSECVNPDNAHSSAEHEKFASSSPWDANETDKTEDNGIVGSELGNVANNKADSIPTCRESVANSEKPTNNNNDTKESRSSQFEDTSELDHESDSDSEAEDNAAASSNRLGNAGPYDSKDAKAHSDRQPQLYSIRNIVIVIMKKNSAFGFTGKLSMKVLYGAVEVYGAILNASKGSMEMYSPRGYSSVVVKTCEEEIPDDRTINDIWIALSAEDVTRDSETKLLEDIDKIEPGTAVLMLRNIENNLTHFLKIYYPLRLFPDVKKSGYYPWTDHRRAEIVLQAHLHMRYLSCRGLFVDSRIIDIANGMLARWRANSWSCALIAGGKDVGKSTSVRFLINRLLHTCEKVVLVDVDPGQSECMPPRCISYSLIEQPLLGPNFTHLQMPVYQLFIDEIDIVQCATRYLKAMNILIVKLKSCPELSRLPIVVNTMGFTKHIGWDLVISTIKLVNPSAILQIVSTNDKNNYKSWLNAHIVNQQSYKWPLHNIPLDDWNKPCNHKLFVMRSNAENKKNKKWNMEPYQQRELALISYLSGITCDSYDPFQCNENQSLKINEAVPYIAPFSSLCIIPQRVFAVPASHALSVINGNIVALCGIDLTEEPSQESDDTSDLRVLTHKTPLCTCYGFGIIRGVDMEQKEIFINTPMPMSMMQHINCLAGCIPIPPSLLQVNEGAPYVGADATLPTSRKHRKGVARGYFMRHQKKSKADNRKSQDTMLCEDTAKHASMPE